MMRPRRWMLREEELEQRQPRQRKSLSNLSAFDQLVAQVLVSEPRLQVSAKAGSVWSKSMCTEAAAREVAGVEEKAAAAAAEGKTLSSALAVAAVPTFDSERPPRWRPLERLPRPRLDVGRQCRRPPW